MLLVINPQFCGNPEEICHSISMSIYSYQKLGGIKYNVDKFDQHCTMVMSEIDIRKVVFPKESSETERTLPLSIGHWAQTITAPVVRVLYHTLLSALISSQPRKWKQRFHWFSIMSWHSSTKRDIMMILSTYKVDIITKTMQVLSLPIVLILYF